MQALQNQVLADLEKESTEELERNLKHIRETAQRETREKIMDNCVSCAKLFALYLFLDSDAFGDDPLKGH